MKFSFNIIFQCLRKAWKFDSFYEKSESSITHFTLSLLTFFHRRKLKSFHIIFSSMSWEKLFQIFTAAIFYSKDFSFLKIFTVMENLFQIFTTANLLSIFGTSENVQCLGKFDWKFHYCKIFMRRFFTAENFHHLRYFFISALISVSDCFS